MSRCFLNLALNFNLLLTLRFIKLVYNNIIKIKGKIMKKIALILSLFYGLF